MRPLITLILPLTIMACSMEDTTQQESVAPVQTLYRPDAVVWAVNFGGEAYSARDGVNFAADELPDDEGVGQVAEVSGVQEQTVFRSFREGELSLEQALPNGFYDLTLFFIEPADIPTGERVFDVLVQGDVAVPGLDIRQMRDGRQNAGLMHTVTDIEVTDGRLQLALRADKGVPVISGFVLRDRGADQRSWELVWSDEFDYEGPPDPAKWTHDVWDARRVNDENQAYTDRSKNVRVSDGRLILEAHLEDYNGASYTSGRIHSRGKGDWLYGRIDLRAKLPGGQGSWPALWMLPTDAFRYAGDCGDADPADWQGKADCPAWPNSGEIDIMEHVGYDMPRLHGTVHNKAYYHVNFQQRKGSVQVSGLEKDFHVYSLEWTPDYIRIFFEGIPYFSYYNEGEGWESWPYDHPYHLIMNLAVGGEWGRAGGPIDDSIFPITHEVDYVRVFKPAAAD